MVALFTFTSFFMRKNRRKDFLDQIPCMCLCLDPFCGWLETGFIMKEMKMKRGKWQRDMSSARVHAVVLWLIVPNWLPEPFLILLVLSFATFLTMQLLRVGCLREAQAAGNLGCSVLGTYVVLSTLVVRSSVSGVRLPLRSDCSPVSFRIRHLRVHVQALARHVPVYNDLSFDQLLCHLLLSFSAVHTYLLVWILEPWKLS